MSIHISTRTWSTQDVQDLFQNEGLLLPSQSCSGFVQRKGCHSSVCTNNHHLMSSTLKLYSCCWVIFAVRKWNPFFLEVRFNISFLLLSGVERSNVRLLRFKYGRVRMELQGSRLGFNVCVAPSSVKLGVLEFTEVGVGSELDRS